MIQADQAIKQLDARTVNELEHFEYGSDSTHGKVDVVDESYACNIDDLQNLDEATIVVKQGRYDYSIDPIRQIQDAKVEIQQDGYNCVIDDMENFKSEPIYADEYASEVLLQGMKGLWEIGIPLA